MCTTPVYTVPPIPMWIFPMTFLCNTNLPPLIPISPSTRLTPPLTKIVRRVIPQHRNPLAIFPDHLTLPLTPSSLRQLPLDMYLKITYKPHPQSIHNPQPLTKPRPRTSSNTYPQPTHNLWPQIIHNPHFQTIYNACPYVLHPCTIPIPSIFNPYPNPN